MVYFKPFSKSWCLLGAARVDRNGDNPREVLIDPPNIRTKPVKKGAAIDSVLFSKPGVNALGDPYVQRYGSVLDRKENRARQIECGNEKPFKPQSHVKHPVKASYIHMTDFVEIQKNYKDEENPRDVVIPPRNIMTNPIKKGKIGKQVTFGGTIPYIEDDYNRPKLFAAAEREYHYSKLQEKPFSQKCRKKDTFNSNRQLLEENPMIPHRAPKPKTAPALEHDKPFRPSHPPRKGHNKTLAAFPKYQEDPKKPITRRVPVEGDDDKPKFKPTHNVKSRPTPGIATNMRNIKTSFPSVFRK